VSRVYLEISENNGRWSVKLQLYLCTIDRKLHIDPARSGILQKLFPEFLFKRFRR
jgi:hypothetical protein